MQRCTKCNHEKDSTEFYVSNKSNCKECIKERVRTNRKEKVEYYRQYDRDRFKNDPKVRERHRKYLETEVGKMVSNRLKMEWCKNNPIKRRASHAVNNAVRDGKLSKPSVCESCNKHHERIHGHHCDYSKPLEVMWLCPKCHKAWHKENGEGKVAA